MSIPRKITVSYIATSLDRIIDITSLISSIEGQKSTVAEHEIVICGQSDTMVNYVRKQYPHIKCLYVGRLPLSQARNIGLRYATGDYVCFPDDDCFYDPYFVSEALHAFEADPTLGFVAGRVVDQETLRAWHGADAVEGITFSNVWKNVISVNFVVKGHIASKLDGFDPGLGVGTMFGAGEETDFIIRALRQGYKGRTAPSCKVYHLLKPLNPARVKTYGRGIGAVYRKHLGICLRHPLFFHRTLMSFIRPLLACLIHIRAYEVYLSSFRGRVSGFITWNRARV